MKITMEEPEKVEEKIEREDEREAIKKSFAGERKKLSSMTLKEKITYIWAYYKAPIIGVLLIGILVGYFISALVSRKEAVLTGVFVDVTANNAEIFADYLGEYMALDNKHEISVIDAINLNSGSAYSTRNYTGAAQILTVIATKELDFAFTDKQGLKYLEENKILKDLKELMPAEIYEAFSPRMYISEQGTSLAMDMSATRLYSDLSVANLIDVKDISFYFCVQNLSGHDEELQLLFKFLYEYEYGTSSLLFTAK